MNPERICYGCFSEKDPGTVCPVCGFDETKQQPYLALPLGTIVNGRYLIGKVLGIGGFGITYLGFDLTLEIKVAIKEYMPSAMATRNTDRYTVVLTSHQEKDYQSGMERFLEEARILAKLQNTPNIVSVQNYFRENNTAYFVMEYVNGTSLKAYLAAHGEKISCEEALKILLPVMNALVSVHSMQLLHRDISPDNIYLTADGDSRLLDFGAARFASGDGKSVTFVNGYELPLDDLGEEAADGQEVLISVRPEEFSIQQDGLPCRVKTKVFLGKYINYSLEFPAEMLQPGQPSIEFSQDLGHAERILEVGDTVTLRPNRRKVNVFLADGSRNILKDVVHYE